MSTSNTLKRTVAALLALGGLAASTRAQPAPKPGRRGRGPPLGQDPLQRRDHRGGWRLDPQLRAPGAPQPLVGARRVATGRAAVRPSRTRASSDQDVVFRQSPSGYRVYPRTPTTNGRSAPPAERLAKVRRGSRQGSPEPVRGRLHVPEGPGDLQRSGSRSPRTPGRPSGLRTGETSSVTLRGLARAPFSAGVRHHEGMVITVTHDIKDMAVRLVAVGLDGKEYPAIESDKGGVNNMYQLTAEFRPASREDPGVPGFSPALTNGWRSRASPSNPLAAASGSINLRMTGVAAIITVAGKIRGVEDGMVGNLPISNGSC